ncbi:MULTISPECIES: hypothetical protein [Mycolicibacterium]|uniref:DUF2746 domain-containing protein n=1 Tax=Mycolicibacterium nivoides TaxID=2487344 RepID=A0ABW9L7L2_9MYCO|nr:DUF2746 domain-containing protein [Mycobacteriaceae bacterium Msp059]
MTLPEVIRAAAEYYEPNDAIGLAGLFVIGLPSILAAVASIAAIVVSVRGQRRGKDRREEDRAVLNDVSEKVNVLPDVQRKVDVVRNNVQNGHSDPLRDDLDRQFAAIHRKVEEKFNEQARDLRAMRNDVRRDIGGIREEIRTERQERIEGDKRRCK